MGFNQNLGIQGFFWDRDKTEKEKELTSWLFAGDGSSGYGGKSIEKEKEKKKAQTFLLGSACVCLWRQEDKIVLGERREKRTRARENQPFDLCRLWAPPKSEKIED